ncbi:BTAD domain-containing putative transcriptional regulator [Actinopolymorpha sp. B17G11]|uniref:AfsR/SARP family transcriptional regulator n=1 Tax=Actinopolymorpha sp. B17G11 TaxID=3160861 RepID=UPI0032E4605E
MRFEILGALMVHSDDERPLDLGSAKQQLLLAVLLCCRNRTVSTDRLLSQLWSSEPPPSARKNLQGNILRLRRALHDHERIAHQQNGYALRVEPGEADADQFEHDVAEARNLYQAGDMDGAVDRYRAALSLWRGSAFETVEPVDLLRDEAARLDELRLVVQTELYDAELTHGSPATALVPELSALVAQFPLREKFTAQLMLGLYRCGRTADALAAFARTRDLLGEELGLDPSKELRDLEVAILRGDPALDAPPPNRQPPPTPGTPLRLPPVQLPPLTEGFTGRVAELARLDTLLAPVGSDHPRVVVLSGMGGVGKTALAVRWARAAAARFPDGQLYLDMRGYASAPAVSADEALGHFLRGLGVEPDSTPDNFDEALAAYRSALADKAVLVVLDNVADAAQVRPLLPTSPASCTLITSRDRLTGLIARDGARRLPLDTLTQSDAEAVLREQLDPDRMPDELEAVPSLAVLCARLPLALRIAAGGLADHPHMSVGDYVAELSTSDVLGSLAIDGDDEAAVRATFDLSYQRLAEAERRLFRLLGLLPGPDFTAPAAAALAGVSVPDARRGLARLISAHLITEHAAGRFTFHDLLRQYARATAVAAEPADRRQAAIDRLLAWYYATTADAHAIRYPASLRLPSPTLPPDIPSVEVVSTEAALAWYEDEQLNLVDAVLHAAESGPHHWSWLLAELIGTYLFRTGHVSHSSQVVDAALAAATGRADPAALASAYMGHATKFRRSDYKAARQDYTFALQYATQAADEARQSGILNNLAVLDTNEGHYADARQLLHRSLEIKQRAGGPGSELTTLDNLGRLARYLGDFEGSLTYFRQCVNSGAESPAQATSYANLAEILSILGRPAEALDVLDRQVAERGELDDPVMLFNAAFTRSLILADLGRLLEAEADRVRCVNLSGDLGLGHSGDALNVSGYVRLRSNDPADALDAFTDAHAIAERLGNLALRLNALVGLAESAELLGLHDDARRHCGTVSALAEPAGAISFRALGLTVLSRVELASAHVDAAVEAAEESLAIHRETGHHLGKARALVALAQALRAKGSDDPDGRVDAYLSEAYELFRSFGSPQADAVADLLG